MAARTIYLLNITITSLNTTYDKTKLHTFRQYITEMYHDSLTSMWPRDTAARNAFLYRPPGTFIS